MYSREAYEITQANSATLLETFAEMCIPPHIRTTHSLIGLTHGISSDIGKILLRPGSREFQDATVSLRGNDSLFNGLLKGAQTLQTQSELELRQRFNINDFVANNLLAGEDAGNILKAYGLYRRDDYRWHFDLYYRTPIVQSRYLSAQSGDILELTVSDNGDDSLPNDEQFIAFNQRYFQSVIERLAKSRIPKT